MFEVLGSESEEVETNEQKFERIRCELSELYDSLQNQVLFVSFAFVNERIISFVGSYKVKLKIIMFLLISLHKFCS